MNKEFFRKFIYLAAVQIILVSQLLIITNALIASPAFAESGSGSDGQTVETVSDNSGSGSSSSEDNSGSGTSGSSSTDESEGAVEQTVDTTDPALADGSNSGSGLADGAVSTEETSVTDESAGATEQTADTSDPALADGSNSGSGSATQEPATTGTQSNSGTGSGGQENQATAESNSGTGNADQQVVSEEPTISGEVTAPVGGTETEVATADAPGDTIHAAPEGTAPEGTPTTILEQTTVPAAGEIDPATGFPVAYQDATGLALMPCLDGTDPNCVLPAAGEELGFDPTQPSVLGENFPSEFFYWIAESDALDTPNGGKTFIRTAVEGAFLNEEPLEGDQMVFGRIRVTGTGLEPNSTYTVTHPYGVDTYLTNEEGIITRGKGTLDIGCASGPCNFNEALQSPVFENFLRWDSGAPVGYIGDGATPHTVVGSPTGDNFFRIEGPGLPLEGLFTNLFAVAGKVLSGEFIPNLSEPAPAEQPQVPGDSAVGEVNLLNGFPETYADANGITVVPCLDGTDPNCVLPGAGEEPNFDPSQPTVLGTNFPSEFFYWIAESDRLDTPNGGRTMFRMALEGAFLNEEPTPGDQMVFGRLRLTATGLEPNSVYTVAHPYGVDTYVTDERGIVRRGEGTEDIGCFSAPCDFAAALQSRVFESFLQMESGAPAGYLGDGAILGRVIGSPLGQNFFRLEGPGLPLGGLFTNLFTVAGKLLTEAVLPIVGGVVTDGDTPDVVDAAPVEEPVVADPGTEADVAEPVVDTDLPAEEIAADLITEDNGTEVPLVEEGLVGDDPIEGEQEEAEDDGVVTGEPETAINTLPDGNLTLTTEDLSSSETGNSSSSADESSTQSVSTTESSSNSSSQESGSQTQAVVSGSSGNNSDGGSSSSNSGAAGEPEAEARGSAAEGELAGVDEELVAAAGGILDSEALIFATENQTESEGLTSEETLGAEAVASGEEQQQSNLLEILLALASLAIAGGLASSSALGNLKLRLR